MENQEELTQVQMALVVLGKTCDLGLKAGAFNRGEVIQYNEALNILNKELFKPEDEPGE